MTDLPDVKLKALLTFPTAVIDGTGVSITKHNGTYKFDIAFDDFAPPVAGAPDAPHQNVLLWNSITGVYSLVPITVVGTGGAVNEAPNDGVPYSRQSLTWTPAGTTVPPAISLPLINGTAAIGIVTRYAKEDHVHPTDTTRAPLASPAFSGIPTAPTASSGTTTTQLATTQFVAAAISATGAGNASIAVSDTPPVAPTDNMLWWESDSGRMYIYFNDGNTRQFVPITLGLTGPTGATGATGPTGPAGSVDGVVAQNPQSANYTTVLGDAGGSIFHPSADTSARTWTIAANAAVAYRIGTLITFINQHGAGVITIAINTDTLRIAGSGTTGSRSLAADGMATVTKVTTTEWLISGTGLT